MNLKRILTSIIGLPLVILLIVFGTPQIISFAIMLIAVICMYEYFSVIKKICNPIEWARIFKYYSYFSSFDFTNKYISNNCNARNTYNTINIVFAYNSNRYENNI